MVGINQLDKASEIDSPSDSEWPNFKNFQGLRPLTPWGAYSAPKPPAAQQPLRGRCFATVASQLFLPLRGYHNNITFFTTLNPPLVWKFKSWSNWFRERHRTSHVGKYTNLVCFPSGFKTIGDVYSFTRRICYFCRQVWILKFKFQFYLFSFSLPLYKEKTVKEICYLNNMCNSMCNYYVIDKL